MGLILTTHILWDYFKPDVSSKRFKYMTNVTYGHLIKYYFKSLYIPQINGGCASYFSLSKCSFLMISSAPILF